MAVCVCACVHVQLLSKGGAFGYLLPIISFVLAWIETWLLDFKVLPQEAEDENSKSPLCQMVVLKSPRFGHFASRQNIKCHKILSEIYFLVHFCSTFLLSPGGTVLYHQGASLLLGFAFVFFPFYMVFYTHMHTQHCCTTVTATACTLAGLLFAVSATERAPLMHPGPLSDGQFYSPPESVAGQFTLGDRK